MAVMRHVSVFRLKPECRTPEVIEAVASALRELPRQIPTIIGCEVGVKPFAMPPVSPDGHVRFFDLIQIITFASPADCAGYPATAGHRQFLASSSRYMEEVIGIDYPAE